MHRDTRLISLAQVAEKNSIFAVLITVERLNFLEFQKFLEFLVFMFLLIIFAIFSFHFSQFQHAVSM